MNSYQVDIAKTWDNINECLVDKTKAISHEDFMRAKEGELKVSLADTFDMIFNPVSNCYIESLQSVWKECARVIRKILSFPVRNR